MVGCAPSADAAAVHVALLASGSQLHEALSLAANVQLWSESPSRICFHVLADEAALRALEVAPLLLVAP